MEEVAHQTMNCVHPVKYERKQLKTWSMRGWGPGALANFMEQYDYSLGYQKNTNSDKEESSLVQYLIYHWDGDIVYCVLPSHLFTVLKRHQYESKFSGLQGKCETLCELHW